MNEHTAYPSQNMGFDKNPWYQYNYPHSSDIVAVAYRIAEKAHHGVFRAKKHVKAPYLTHPIMVCLLLERLGQANDLNIAIALLHDVLEDCEPYKSNHSLLKAELKAGLIEMGFDERGAVNTATYIFQHCEELCNDRIMEEDKRTFQVMHAHAMTDRSKLIKILDQAASVLDDIFLESSRPRDKIERFASKALGVVKAAARGGTQEILAAESIFHDLYYELRHIHKKIAGGDESARQHYDPEKTIRETVEKLERRALVPRLRHPLAPDMVCMHPAIESRKDGQTLPLSGCVGVAFVKGDKDNMLVSGYDCLIDRELDQFSAANRATWYLMGELESFEQENYVDFGEARIEGRQLVRRYSVSPPVPYEQFVKAARSAEGQVKKAARESKVDVVSPTPVLDHRISTHIKNELAEYAAQEINR